MIQAGVETVGGKSVLLDGNEISGGGYTHGKRLR